MGDSAANLLTGWALACPWLYLVAVVVAATYVRAVLTTLWIIEADTEKPRRGVSIYRLWWWRFRSKSPECSDPDHWHPLVLGVLELAVAPVFIFIGAWLPIGGWLTLKTVAQWETWKSSRHTFNRFLIGNALVLICAYFIAKWFLRILPE